MMKGPTSFFYMWIASWPRTICWKNCSFPIELIWYPCQKLVTGNMRICFWTPNSIPSIYMSILLLVPKSPLVQFRSVQSLSRVRLFATPWTAARQATLSIINSRKSTQTHVHRVGDAIQPSHPLSSPSPPAFNLPIGSKFWNRELWIL